MNIHKNKTIDEISFSGTDEAILICKEVVDEQEGFTCYQITGKEPLVKASVKGWFPKLALAILFGELLEKEVSNTYEYVIHPYPHARQPETLITAAAHFNTMGAMGWEMCGNIHNGTAVIWKRRKSISRVIEDMNSWVD